MNVNTIYNAFAIFTIIVLSVHPYYVEHYFAEITYVNEKYLTEAKLFNVKPNRTSRAFSSFHCQNIDLTGKDFKLNVHAYYEEQVIRDAALQFDLNICDSLRKNTYGVQSILKYGNLTKCPIKKGCYALNNFGVRGDMLPPFLPLKKYLIKMKIYYNSILLHEIHWHGELKKDIRQNYSSG